MKPMTTRTLAHWYGSNRILAEAVGKLLTGCSFVAIPFAGGMCEVPCIQARTKLVGDVHRHVINLARVVADPGLRPQLEARLEQKCFHPDELAAAQAYCLNIEKTISSGLFVDRSVLPVFPLEWAEAFFVATWMSRGGNAGTKNEFNAGQSVRYDAGGGDSNARYRSAVDSMEAWQHAMIGCNFVCEDFRELLSVVKDEPGVGIYEDCPWVGLGASYKHPFTERDHRDLARINGGYKQARVVVRYGVCPLVEELYPRTEWDWREQVSRSQANGAVKEVLLCKNLK